MKNFKINAQNNSAKIKTTKTVGKETPRIIRKSPTVLLPDALKILILTVIGFAGLFYGKNQAVSIIALVLLVLAAAFSFYVWLVWYYDVYVLTQGKMIEVKKKGLFSKKVVELPYSAVENASYEISGPLATLFKVGDVKIHSSLSHTINLETVRRPDRIRDEIIKLVHN